MLGKELKNQQVFNNVSVSFNSIDWNNNADIDPESLYEDGVKLESGYRLKRN